jgi:hypothetical protein
MRRAIHALIRIVGCFVLVWFSVAAFHSARERDLPALCVEIGFLLSGVPYVIYPQRSPFLHHGRKPVGDAIVSLREDLKRSGRPGSLFISMGVGSMIFFGAGLALLVYEHFVR